MGFEGRVVSTPCLTPAPGLTRTPLWTRLPSNQPVFAPKLWRSSARPAPALHHLNYQRQGPCPPSEHHHLYLGSVCWCKKKEGCKVVLVVSSVLQLWVIGMGASGPTEHASSKMDEKYMKYLLFQNKYTLKCGYGYSGYTNLIQSFKTDLTHFTHGSITCL